MLLKKKRIFIIFIFMLLCFCISVSGALAAYGGADTAANQGYGSGSASLTATIPGTIGKVVGAGLAFIGILFLILMIYGGFIWMMARGNDQEVTKAKELIISAVIGIIIVFAAYAITVYLSGVLK